MLDLDAECSLHYADRHVCDPDVAKHLRLFGRTKHGGLARLLGHNLDSRPYSPSSRGSYQGPLHGLKTQKQGNLSKGEDYRGPFDPVQSLSPVPNHGCGRIQPAKLA